jgi:hypothetical protein
MGEDIVSTKPVMSRSPFTHGSASPCSLASTIYQIFVGSDSSSSVFQQMKRIHGMMPYFVLRGILRISNPMAMIRSTLDLFLARPFGRTSLLQMMFSSQLNDEVKELKEDMEKVAAKVEDDRLVQKVKNYVNAPKEIQQFYKADAGEWCIHPASAVRPIADGRRICLACCSRPGRRPDVGDLAISRRAPIG